MATSNDPCHHVTCCQQCDTKTAKSSEEKCGGSCSQCLCLVNSFSCQQMQILKLQQAVESLSVACQNLPTGPCHSECKQRQILALQETLESLSLRIRYRDKCKALSDVNSCDCLNTSQCGKSSDPKVKVQANAVMPSQKTAQSTCCDRSDTQRSNTSENVSCDVKVTQISTVTQARTGDENNDKVSCTVFTLIKNEKKLPFSIDVFWVFFLSKFLKNYQNSCGYFENTLLIEFVNFYLNLIIFVIACRL